MAFAKDLRASVLQAAMQGKLTKQLETDTPVSELLADIKAEKDRLIAEKKIKKEKPLLPITDDDIPFDIPESWEWVRVGDIVSNRAGLSYNKENLTKKSDNMVRVLRGGNIFDGTYNFKPDDVMIDSSFVKSELFLNKNTIITPAVTSLEHIGKMARIEQTFTDTVVGGFVLMLTPHLNDDVLSQYLLYVFLEPSFRDRCRNITNKSGQAFYNLSRQKLMELVIPLPPIEEQKRIVQRIEEIMKHIAELEAIEEELKKLKEVFPADMKAAVLQAAMQGKLTEQLDTDSSVDDLLEDIKKEREKLIAEGKVKKSRAKQNDNLVAFRDGEEPFEIPNNWSHVTMQSIFEFVDYRGKTPHKTNFGIPLITASNVRLGFMDYTRKEYISNEEYLQRQSRGITRKGDILFTTEAPLGMVAICDLEKSSCGQRVITLQKYSDKINTKFLVFFMQSQQFTKQLLDKATGTTAKGIKAEKLKQLWLALPPLEEQNRIVAKLEQILPLISDLS